MKRILELEDEQYADHKKLKHSNERLTEYKIRLASSEMNAVTWHRRSESLHETIKSLQKREESLSVQIYSLNTKIQDLQHELYTANKNIEQRHRSDVCIRANRWRGGELKPLMFVRSFFHRHSDCWIAR